MPQSSTEMYELVNWIIKQENDEIPDEGKVIKFLEERSYKLLPSWLWRLPKPEHYITEKEMLCMRYLIEEWDFGGIEENGP